MLTAVVGVALPLASALSHARPGAAQPRAAVAAPSSVALTWLDRTADACTDFYQFACGGWRAANPIPADRQRWGQFTMLEENNLEILKKILESPTPAADASRRKAADFYAACMDERTIESKGPTPLASDLARIDRVKQPRDIPPLLAHLHDIGVPAFFRFAAQIDRRDAARQIAIVDQAGLGMPDRDYYLKTDARSAEIRQKYQTHVQTTLAMLPGAAPDPAKDAAAVVAIEHAIATAELDRTTRRDPAAITHIMSRAEWQALTPSFDWPSYLAAAGAPAFNQLNVAVPDYFRALNTLLASTPIENVKAYLRWHLANSASELLPRAFDTAHFEFFNARSADSSKSCPAGSDASRRPTRSSGRRSARRSSTTPSARPRKTRRLRWFSGIEAAMKQDIDEASWMSEETKRAARAKLAAVVDRIGYPDTWRDYASVRIDRSDALGNRQRAHRVRTSAHDAARSAGRSIAASGQ